MYLIWLLFLANFLCYEACEDDCFCNPEVQRLRDYLTIDTTPGKDLRPAVDFWRRLAREHNVEMNVYVNKSNFPVIVFRWPGSNSSLSSILLISHMDVLDANYEDGWTFPPFTGHITDECEIFARGLQAMKTSTIQQFEALSYLRENNTILLRDVYMVITPDNNMGSENGMAIFVKTKEFLDMNVGMALDVGLPNEGEEIHIFHQDKTRYVIEVDCYGTPTHSAFMLDASTSAIKVCSSFCGLYVQFREEQYNLSLASTDFGQFTAINLIGIGEVPTATVTPAEIKMTFAINLAHNTSLNDFKQMLHEWAEKAGFLILHENYLKTRSLITKIDDSNPYWTTINDVFDELNIDLLPGTMPTTTDASFVVDVGIPCFGITPQRNTTLLIGGVNEHLSISIFNEGIEIYEKLISNLANLPEGKVSDDPSIYLTKPEIL